MNLKKAVGAEGLEGLEGGPLEEGGGQDPMMWGPGVPSLSMGRQWLPSWGSIPLLSWPHSSLGFRVGVHSMG
jgi:hypothetical protein